MSKSQKKKTDPQKDEAQKSFATDIENTGNYLRTLRLGKGLSTKEVTEATRISEINIIAIEDQNYSSLPADTFTRGLLNIYSKFLGADAERVIAKFMEERDKTTAQKKRTQYKQTSRILTPKRLAEPTHISSMTMAGALFLIIIICFAGYCFYTSWNPFSFLFKDTDDMQLVMEDVLPKDKSAPSPVEEKKNITAPQKSPETLSSTIQESSQDAKSSPQLLSDETVDKPEGQNVVQGTDIQNTTYSVTISFLEDSTIELKKDDNETLSLEFAKGDVHSLIADSSLLLEFSQPDSAEIVVNDIKIDFPQERDGKHTLQIPQDITKTLSNETLPHSWPNPLRQRP